MSKSELIRSNILKEAAVLFSQRGYERTSMREIAKNVGVSKPAIYYHFSNKQTLFEELVTSSFKMSKDTLTDIANSGGDPIQNLKDLAKRFFSSTRNNPDRARFLCDLSSGNIRKDIKLSHSKVFSKHKALFNQILNRGKEEGLIKKEMDNATFIMIFMGTINMYMIAYIKGEIDHLDDDTVEHFVELLLNGIKK